MLARSKRPGQPSLIESTSYRCIAEGIEAVTGASCQSAVAGGVATYADATHRFTEAELFEFYSKHKSPSYRIGFTDWLAKHYRVLSEADTDSGEDDPNQDDANATDPADAAMPTPPKKKAGKKDADEPKYNFQLADVQTYYDTLIVRGEEEDVALEKTLVKFGLPEKDVEVNPMGMVSVKDLEPALPHPDDADKAGKMIPPSASAPAANVPSTTIHYQSTGTPSDSEEETTDDETATSKTSTTTAKEGA